MNDCPICSRPTLQYAFTDNLENRYLECRTCKLIINSMQIGIEASSGGIGNQSTQIESIPDLLHQLDSINPGSDVNLVLPYWPWEQGGGVEAQPFNFVLSLETIYRLLNSHFFESVAFKVINERQIAISARKKFSNIFRVSFIVPAYNEESSVEGVVRGLLDLRLEGCEKELIIVESNSNDSTRSIVSEFETFPNVRVIYQGSARGKGNAVREGIAQATGDFICIQDADDEYDLRDYLNLIPALILEGKSFVLGSRHARYWWKMRSFESQKVLSLILNGGQLFFTFLINFVTRCQMSDPFTMFKLFRRDAISGITFVSNRFDLDFEIVIKLINAGHIPYEIPVNYRSRSFRQGKKVRMLRDPITWIRALYTFGVKKQI